MLTDRKSVKNSFISMSNIRASVSNKRFSTPKRSLCIVIASTIVCVIIASKGLVAFEDWHTIKNYYSYEGDALPSADDLTFSPKPGSIFFHVTSFHGKLTAQQACSVESAARAHPLSTIYVLFSSPVTDQVLKTTCIAKLLQFPNVKFLRVHMAEYSKGTVVQSILANDLKKSSFPTQHSADILSILTLNRWGGIYLDTSIIIAKSLKTLSSNWIVRRREMLADTGIMAFAKDEIGSNITNLILKEIHDTYNPDNWSVKRTIQRVIRRLCPGIILFNNCKGIDMYPSNLFFPMNSLLWKFKFKVIDYEPNYSFRMWNLQSNNRSIVAHKRYEILARKYCPSIFLMHAQELEL